MPLYSLKVQALATRWKHFHSSSSAIFVDDAVPQWVLYQGRRLRLVSGATAPGPALQADEFVKLYSPVNWKC